MCWVTPNFRKTAEKKLFLDVDNTVRTKVKNCLEANDRKKFTSLFKSEKEFSKELDTFLHKQHFRWYVLILSMIRVAFNI